MVDPPAATPWQRIEEGHQQLTRRLPAVRVLWIGLGVLGAYGLYRLGSPAAALSMLALPAAAVVVDLLFQVVRFPDLRFPDAALTTGLFLALILPPTLPIAAGLLVTFAAIALRHTLRTSGRPWVNPAAIGVLFAAALVALPPAWWGAQNALVVVAVGVIVLAFNRATWRLPIAFVLAFALVTTVSRVLATAGSGLEATVSVSLLAVADPSTLFFGLLMVPEPRSAPKDPFLLQPIYGAAIGALVALTPQLFPTLATIIALLLANLAVVLGRMVGTFRALSGTAPRATPPKSRKAQRWSAPVRGATAMLALVTLAVLAPLAVPAGAPSVLIVSSGPPAHVAIPPGSGTARCLQDNPTIPAATLRSLHNALGPSVILSNQPAQNLVVFYDPVHKVTVYETDMYEDFGYAEFNSDDQTTSGCAPP